MHVSSIIVGVWFSADQEKESELKALLKRLRTLSMEESGCEHYELYEDKKKKGQFFILEQWRDHDAFVTHSKQPHVVQAFKEMESLLSEPYKIAHYRVVED